MTRYSKLGLATALTLLAVAPAWAAECNAEIQRVQSRVNTVTDAKVKRLVQYDVTRAKKEAAEADAMECQEAIDHADKLMGTPTPTP